MFFSFSFKLFSLLCWVYTSPIFSLSFTMVSLLVFSSILSSDIALSLSSAKPLSNESSSLIFYFFSAIPFLVIDCLNASLRLANVYFFLYSYSSATSFYILHIWSLCNFWLSTERVKLYSSASFSLNYSFNSSLFNLSESYYSCVFFYISRVS